MSLWFMLVGVKSFVFCTAWMFPTIVQSFAKATQMHGMHTFVDHDERRRVNVSNLPTFVIYFEGRDIIINDVS